MADPPKSEQPKVDVEKVMAEFDARHLMLTAFCARTKSLIEACLQDADIRYQSVQARVKTRKKLREKYLNPAKDYRKLDDITDLAGLRIITYYEDEVDHVAELMEREFDVDAKDSVDKRDIEPDRFGYRAINYICGHKEKRTTDVEYKQYAGVKCEIQVTSILGHAWSEIEHEWYDLREAYPKEVKRRFSRIAALFELAEQEFVDIRDARAKYERAVALQVEAGVPNIPVDAVSLRSFIEQESLVNEIDKTVASTLGYPLTAPLEDPVVETWSRLLNLAGITKLEDLRKALATFRAAIPKFAKTCMTEVWPSAPKGSRAAKGICVYQLGMMMASAAGEKTASEFVRLLGVTAVPINVPLLVAIGKDAVARAGSPA
jgi:putative GTP pyrophosphokinase